MYARKKTFTNKDGSKRTYLQLVESVRENGKVRQKVVANLGRLEDLQEKKLDQAIESLAKFSKANWVRSEAAKLMVKSAREWGSDLIFGQLWERLGLSSILTRLLAETEIASPLDEAIYAMVLNRVCDPLSKRAVYKWISEIYRPSFDQLELQHFYRGLDFLIDHKETIENALFSETRSLFNMQLDMVFWDSTSTYFEGVGPDGLADYGHSKDHRPDRTQIVVGLLMTREGIPIAHQVFPGNMADIDTFKEAIKDVRDRFMLRRVIFVADRGMVSPRLLDELDLAHIEYIVGVKMRRSNAVKAVLKTGGRYLNHNEIVGFEAPEELLSRIWLVFLRDAEDHPQVQKRFEISKNIIGSVAGVSEVSAVGSSHLARMFSLIYLGDYVSLYLACRYGINPGPVKAIDYLKESLAAV